METNHLETAKDKLLADFKTILADTEALLKATASDAGGHVASLRQRIEANLQQAKENLVEDEAALQNALLQEMRDVARATEDYVRNKPWHAIGIAAAIAFAVGFFANRR